MSLLVKVVIDGKVTCTVIVTFLCGAVSLFVDVNTDDGIEDSVTCKRFVTPVVTPVAGVDEATYCVVSFFVNWV